ncbi:anti-sigma factor [Croceicoccus naphthovorans]|uniref:Anti-sigma K factor RskA C-terminal domain-containing protein n=1 Tax=Croceicoccus naphthovorans TaxID=1348774 RepID=A0A0G3XFV3_9SPHN|nr:anti-sigma factor [Croceicoccus naphthovorans]AKM10032.1 hypothetical protein AB433_08660 [Croceicoccus naphthovorans]MBB3991082.1 anti-sigma-K factor RskA [Croceicoccus naphthovorans]
MAEAGDPDMLAGEYALRVLEGQELAEARQRMLSDRAFATEVSWWENRLGTWSEQIAAVQPSASVWQAIEVYLNGTGDDVVMPIRRGPAPWSIAVALAGLGAAAAAIALFVATPGVAPVPTPVPTETGFPSGQLVAQLAAEDGGVRLASVIDPDGRTLSLNARGLQPAEGQASELWVIPEGGAPVSLGLIPADGRLARELSADEADLMREGATFAVTYEQAEGAPHAAPTLPIIVAGTLDQV